MGDAMVTTVTPNAAMDRTLVVPNFQFGRRHRANDGITLPGGRGVTVARTLKQLGVPVIATGMIGGLTGANIVQLLTREGILNDFVQIAKPSRTSTAVIDPVTGGHTEINEYGPRVTAEEVDLLIGKLHYLIRASRLVVLSGSLPRDMPSDTYQRIVRILHASDVMSVVSTPDDATNLRLAMSAEPTFVILDQREAEDVVGHEFTTEDDYLLALDELARQGARSAVILHDEGCVARIRSGRTASYHSARHEPIEVKSEIGSTDVFTAAFVAGVLEESAMNDRLRSAMAVSLANRRTLGAGIFDRHDVSKLAKVVTTRDLEPVVLQDAD